MIPNEKLLRFYLHIKTLRLAKKRLDFKKLKPTLYTLNIKS